MKLGLLKVVFGVGIMASLSACQTTKMAENAVTLGVDFSWKDTKACTTISPAFKISNIPAETAQISFRMVDNQAPGYPHGGSTVKYTGSGDFPIGAIGYVGPCPPTTHYYEWTVQALNADGSLILGEGKATKPFTP